MHTSLAHATGKLRRKRGGKIRQSYELQHIVYAVIALAAGKRGSSQAEGDIVGDVEPRQRRVILEHDADALWRLILDRASFEFDRALGRPGKTCDQFEQRGFAAARRTDYRKELSTLDIEIDRPKRVQRRRRVTRHEHFVDSTELDLLVRHGPLSVRADYFSALRSSGRNRVSMILL
jgi:hypothetical protein